MPIVWIAATIAAAVFAIVLLLVVVVAVNQNRNEPNTSTADSSDDSTAVDVDWQPLFNGRDLTGWTPFEFVDKGPPKLSSTAWTVQDGSVLCATQNTSVLISSEEYGDFVLQMEFQLPPRGGIFILFRTNVDDNRGVKSAGIPIMDELLFNEFIKTVKKGKPSEILAIAEITKAVRPAGEWNTLAIRCEGEADDAQLQVNLNEKQVFDGPLSQFWSKVQATGSLALVSPEGITEGSIFRNIRIRELK